MNAPFYAFARGFVRVVLTAGWRFRVYGVDNVPRDGALIVACNHVAYLDPPALGAALPRPVTYMAKQQLFAIPVLGPVISWLGAFPVDRSRGDVAAFKAALAVLGTQACLGIFPEGTRNRDGTGKAQLGVGFIASRSGAVVVPAYVSGTARARRFARITVTFGPPLPFAAGRQATRDDMAKWTDDLMTRIYALRDAAGDAG